MKAKERKTIVPLLLYFRFCTRLLARSGWVGFLALTWPCDLFSCLFYSIVFVFFFSQSQSQSVFFPFLFFSLCMDVMNYSPLSYTFLWLVLVGMVRERPRKYCSTFFSMPACNMTLYFTLLIVVMGCFFLSRLQWW